MAQLERSIVGLAESILIMKTTMKAVVIERPGPPGVLTLQERPVPKPKTGWVLIRVRAFGLNRSELFTHPPAYSRDRGGGGDRGRSRHRVVARPDRGHGYGRYGPAVRWFLRRIHLRSGQAGANA